MEERDEQVGGNKSTTNSPLVIAREFMEAYRRGDADVLVACLDEGWVLHEEDGSETHRADLADITRGHAEAFPENISSGSMSWSTKTKLHTTFGLSSFIRVAITISNPPASALSCRR
jgi:hypothetical protein